MTIGEATWAQLFKVLKVVAAEAQTGPVLNEVELEHVTHIATVAKTMGIVGSSKWDSVDEPRPQRADEADRDVFQRDRTRSFRCGWACTHLHLSRDDRRCAPDHPRDQRGLLRDRAKPTSARETSSAEARAMTTTSIIAYLMMPIGGVLVGLAVYWLTAESQSSRPPAE